MSLRKITSLTTLLSFILLIITSIFVYIKPQGKIANWANWEVLGLDKGQWEALHTNLGILFIVAGLIHTILNWDCIMAYLKNKAKAVKVFTVDFNIALTITLVVTVLTLFELPPINAIQTFGESLKKAAAEKYGKPPYGHAEDSSIETFCRRTRTDLKTAMENLATAKLQSVSAEASLSEVAKANHLTPQQVYDIIVSDQ
jgi:hypothetical protein